MSSATSSSIRTSTSVKMSDGSTVPLSFRNTTISRYGGVLGATSLLYSPALISSPGSSMMLATPPVHVDFGFSLSPTAGFHPASYKGPGSFGASHLANMESSFCKNFVCCNLELDDLHGLLEHFEERHCQGVDIIGVEGFEGVTLSQMAEGVGVSKDLGFGPGMGNEPMPPGVGNGGFEGEEDWSSEGTHSEPPSPQTRHAIAPAHRSSGPRQTPSTVSNSPSPPAGTVDPSGLTAGGRGSMGYREAVSCRSTPANSVPGTPHIDDDEMEDVEMNVRGHAAGNDTLAHLLRNCSVGRPFNMDPLDRNAANAMGNVGVPPSLLQGGPSGPHMTQFVEQMNAASLAGLLGPLTPNMIDPTNLVKKRSNLDPVTGLTPTGRQPRPWIPPSEKPFKCAVVGCDKAYKQQNGLKYHRTHGHCNQGLTPEEEAKPFVCHHEVCSKRYKNMNGLRYHYQHSGQHGMIGIQLLSLGAHPPPQYPAGHKKVIFPNTSNTPMCSRPSSPSLGMTPMSVSTSALTSPNPSMAVAGPLRFIAPGPTNIGVVKTSPVAAAQAGLFSKGGV